MKLQFSNLFIIIALLCIGQTVKAQKIEDALFKTFSGGGEKCYGRSLIAYQFDTIEEKIITRQAYSFLQEKPPVYRTETERILTEPAHTRIEVTPATFEYITERIKVKDAESYVRSSGEPRGAETYNNKTEMHEVVPAYQRWEKTKVKKDCKSKNEENCLEWQLVEVPATKIAVLKKERVEKDLPATTSLSVSVPEEYVTITKKVLKEPASYKEVQVPAQYTTVSRQILVEPRKYEQVTIPAEYKTIKRVIVIKEGGIMDSNEVVCASEYPRYLRNIQTKLTDLGFYKGSIDGKLNNETKLAIMRYQESQKLPLGQLDFQTLKTLDLIK